VAKTALFQHLPQFHANYRQNELGSAQSPTHKGRGGGGGAPMNPMMTIQFIDIIKIDIQPPDKQDPGTY